MGGRWCTSFITAWSSRVWVAMLMAAGIAGGVGKASDCSCILHWWFSVLSMSYTLDCVSVSMNSAFPFSNALPFRECWIEAVLYTSTKSMFAQHARSRGKQTRSIVDGTTSSVAFERLAYKPFDYCSRQSLLPKYYWSCMIAVCPPPI